MVDEVKVLLKCCLCEREYKPEDRSNIPDVCHSCAVADLRAAVMLVKKLRAEVKKLQQRIDDRIEAGGF